VAVFAIVLNAIPAFMPPIWAVLAYVHTQYGLDLVPLAVVEAGSAATDRFVLAKSSRAFGMRFVPNSWRANIEALVEAIRSYTALSLSFLALFVIGPIPTNHLFIAAGLACVPLMPVVATFGVARFASCVVWVAAADTAARLFSHLLTPSLGGGIGAATQILGFVVLVLVIWIDWVSVIQRTFRRTPGESSPPEISI
jgi:hypothetical protein